MPHNLDDDFDLDYDLDHRLHPHPLRRWGSPYYDYAVYPWLAPPLYPPRAAWGSHPAYPWLAPPLYPSPYAPWGPPAGDGAAGDGCLGRGETRHSVLFLDRHCNVPTGPRCCAGQKEVAYCHGNIEGGMSVGALQCLPRDH